MKQHYFFWLLAAWLSVFAMPSYGVTVTKDQDLAFGNLVAGSGGTVTINPNGGARSVTGGVTPVGNSGYQPALFTVTFAPLELLLNTSVVVTVTPDPATLNGNNGGTMPVTTYTGYPYNLNTNICGLICSLVGTLGYTFQIYVSGTMTVDPGETPGVYTNSINVQVIKN